MKLSRFWKQIKDNVTMPDDYSIHAVIHHPDENRVTEVRFKHLHVDHDSKQIIVHLNPK